MAKVEYSLSSYILATTNAAVYNTLCFLYLLFKSTQNSSSCFFEISHLHLHLPCLALICLHVAIHSVSIAVSDDFITWLDSFGFDGLAIRAPAMQAADYWFRSR